MQGWSRVKHLEALSSKLQISSCSRCVEFSICKIRIKAKAEKNVKYKHHLYDVGFNCYCDTHTHTPGVCVCVCGIVVSDKLWLITHRSGPDHQSQEPKRWIKPGLLCWAERDAISLRLYIPITSTKPEWKRKGYQDSTREMRFWSSQRAVEKVSLIVFRRIWMKRCSQKTTQGQIGLNVLYLYLRDESTRFLTVTLKMCLPSAEFCVPSFGVSSAFSFSSLLCCIVSVSVPWLASNRWLSAEVASAVSAVAELWDPGREVLLLGPWAWLVLLLLVVVGVLGGLSTLCCLEPIGDWLSFSVAVSGGGLSSGFAAAGSSGWLTEPRALPGVWEPPETVASTWVMVCTDSVEAPEDLSSRRSSLDACSSSRIGDSSDSVKTSSEMEPSVLRGAVLPLSLAPGSLRRCSGSFCWEGCLSAGSGSRLLKTWKRHKKEVRNGYL